MNATLQDTPVNLTPVNEGQDTLMSGVLLPTEQEALTTTSAVEVLLKELAGTGFIFVQANQLDGMGQTGSVRVTTEETGTPFTIAQVGVPAGQGIVVCAFPAFIRNGGKIFATSDGIDTVGVCYSFARVKNPVITVFASTDWGTLKEVLPTAADHGVLIGVKEQSAANEHGLLLFDITALPVDASIVKATLRIVDQDASGISNPIESHPVLVPWIGTQASWDDRLTGVAWGIGGGQAGVDYSAAPFSSFTSNLGAGKAYEFDVTALVRKWHSGSLVNNGLIMVNTANVGFDNSQFASLTNATVPDRPSLTIEAF